MNTLLVDPPAAPRSEQPAAADRDGGHSGGPGPSGGEPTPPAPRGRTCANCDAPIQEGQQWCLHCGAAQPGSLAERQSWRPLTALALAAVLLVGAAAAAGAAALESGTSSKPPVTVASAPVTTTPTVPTPTTSVPTTPTVPATPGATGTPTVPGVGGSKPRPVGTGTGNSLFPSTGKPPKIPSTSPTLKSSGTGTSTGAGSTVGTGTGSSEKTSTTPSSKSESGGGSGKQAEETPSALLLDTNAASTYNPYNYPAAGFGDPALAIDGEPTTAWTAQVQPSSAPNMAEGLLIDLKSPTRVGAVTLVTRTKGMTVQFYGTTEKKAPATITEAGWKQVSATHVLKKHTTHIKLHGAQTLRYLLVWVVKAPESAVGTPQAPGHVALNEVELFPPAS